MRMRQRHHEENPPPDFPTKLSGYPALPDFIITDSSPSTPPQSADATTASVLSTVVTNRFACSAAVSAGSMEPVSKIAENRRRAIAQASQVQLFSASCSTGGLTDLINAYRLTASSDLRTLNVILPRALLSSRNARRNFTGSSE